LSGCARARRLECPVPAFGVRPRRVFSTLLKSHPSDQILRRISTLAKCIQTGGQFAKNTGLCFSKTLTERRPFKPRTRRIRPSGKSCDFKPFFLKKNHGFNL
jgi:hypothetical protein